MTESHSPIKRPSILVQKCNPRHWEAEARGLLQVRSQLGLQTEFQASLGYREMLS